MRSRLTLAAIALAAVAGAMPAQAQAQAAPTTMAKIASLIGNIGRNIG